MISRQTTINEALYFLFTLQHHAPMVTSGFEVVQTTMKVVLKSVTTMPGALCVMTPGVLLMPMWPADSLDSLQQVAIIYSTCRLWSVNSLTHFHCCT